MKGSIKIDREQCKGCGLCTAACPKKIIVFSDKLNKKGYYPASCDGQEAKEGNTAECTGCALCAIVCPDIAIEVYRE
ncbi:MAG: 4Fe-4S binding protein [Deltaproteobacteria bacterium]|nr:4Fe-4S binding protein [Deltaproteobacteria bacterium]